MLYCWPSTGRFDYENANDWRHLVAHMGSYGVLLEHYDTKWHQPRCGRFDDHRRKGLNGGRESDRRFGIGRLTGRWREHGLGWLSDRWLNGRCRHRWNHRRDLNRRLWWNDWRSKCRWTHGGTIQRRWPELRHGRFWGRFTGRE